MSRDLILRYNQTNFRCEVLQTTTPQQISEMLFEFLTLNLALSMYDVFVF